MIRPLAIVSVICAVVPFAAAAQDGVPPAPRGHHQPTASEVPPENGMDQSSRLGPNASADTAGSKLPGTQPMRAGRSVKKGANVAKSDIDVGPVEVTPRICTNCDD